MANGTVSLVSTASNGNLKASIVGPSKEMEQIIRRLEQGSVLTKFYPKGRPDRRLFCIKLDTRQIVWMRSVTGKSALEGQVDLSEVKEVRIGSCSRIFEKWQEDAKKWENGQCFVVLYGNIFRLKTLSCVGKLSTFLLCTSTNKAFQTFQQHHHENVSNGFVVSII